MSILASDDAILAALLIEGDSHNLPDSVPDKRIPGGQMRGQISPAIQQEVVTRAVLPLLREAIAEALRERKGRDAVALPRAATFAQFKNTRYRSSTGTYPRLSKHLGDIGWRMVNDLARAGHEKPDLVDFAAALHEYLCETFPDSIRVRSSSSVQLTEFERWATISSWKAVDLSVSKATGALKKWDPRFHETQAVRGGAGGRRSKRPHTWTDAELDRIVSTMELTVDEHVRLLRGKYSDSTIKRMRKAARGLIEAQPAPAPVPVTALEPKRLDSERTSTDRRSDDRREATQRRWARSELDPHLVAQAVEDRATREANLEARLRDHEAYLQAVDEHNRTHAPVPEEDYGYLLDYA